jgi:hypothetical protein
MEYNVGATCANRSRDDREERYAFESRSQPGTGVIPGVRLVLKGGTTKVEEIRDSKEHRVSCTSVLLRSTTVGLQGMVLRPF